MLPASAIKYLEAHIDDFAASVAAGEREGVLTFIRSALASGQGAGALGIGLRAYFAAGIHRVGSDGVTQFVVPVDEWADTVARTELSAAYNGGKRELYLSAGLTQWMWVTAHDERTCPECAAIDGEVVEIGAPFSSGDDQPPAHPNCLCTVVSDPTAMNDLNNAFRGDAGDEGDGL
ncbi:MAG: hypothetical protein NVSMB19_23170 [Vulcanimicrobiaceae bacterium]